MIVIQRDKEEKRWINRMSNIVPRGLNLLDYETTILAQRQIITMKLNIISLVTEIYINFIT